MQVLAQEGEDLAACGSSRRDEVMSTAVHWIAGKIGEPGVGAAFAGVFSDAVSDAALRTILATRLQEPYRLALRDFPAVAVIVACHTLYR